MGVTEVVLTLKDFADLEPNSLCIVTQELSDGLHLTIMPMEEGLKAVKEDARKRLM